VCEEEPCLLELVRSTHLNPLGAGIVRTLEELEGYARCGHGVLTGRRRNDWQQTGYVLLRFHEERTRSIDRVIRGMYEEQGVSEAEMRVRGVASRYSTSRVDMWSIPLEAL